MKRSLLLAVVVVLLVDGLALSENHRYVPDGWAVQTSWDGIVVQPGEWALDACGGRGKCYLHPGPDAANINHLWSVRPVGEYVMFVSRVDDMALDANAGTGNPYPRPADPANDNHLWIFARVGDHVMIWSKVSGAVLDASGGQGLPYLSSEPDPRNVNHLWELRPVGADVMIVPMLKQSKAADAVGVTQALKPSDW